MKFHTYRDGRPDYAFHYDKRGAGRGEILGLGDGEILRMYVRKNAWQTFQNKVQ